MEDNNIEVKQQKIIKISKKKLIITVIIAVVTFVIWNDFHDDRHYIHNNVDYTENMTERSSVAEMPIQTRGTVESGEMMLRDSMYYPEPMPPYWNRDVDITDIREFLKTSYFANIFTKNVRGTVDKVEYAIRSVGGRVDNLSSSERYGSVLFVIAKSNLSEFRDEIEKVAHVKFYTENISSENLLFQKQNIEGRSEGIIESLDEAELAKRNLDQSHNERISYWTAQILALQEQLGDVVYEDRNSLIVNGDEKTVQRQTIVGPEDEALMIQIIALQQKQKAENINYAYKNKSLVAQINNFGGNLEVLKEEDLDLLNDIETVEGYINVEWISSWERLDRISPIPMWINTVVLILIILWFLKWRKIIPKIELL